MQMQAMAQELDQMHSMLQRVSQSMEARELDIKEAQARIQAFDAETKRISAVQAGLSEEQVQDIVMGTMRGMLTSGDLVAPMVEQEMPPMMEPPIEGPV
jgi:uncharacterized protein (DUF3084 family)